jgi:pimeloyl-ACP methyl ester carboxylesterase
VTSLSRARKAAATQTARLSDGETAYHLEGERGPWVVLVHGLVTPGYAWQPLAETLAAQGFRVLHYDQFGRGLSDRPATRYDLDLYIRQLRELTDHLGIDEMHLVGWSLGGVIVTRFAAERPARVKSITLIAPALYQQSRGMRLLSQLPGAGRLIAWRVGDVIDRLDKVHLSRPDRFPGYGKRAREQLAFPGMAESFASTVTNFPWASGDEWRAVGEHPRPVLVIWGDTDRATPYRNASRVLRLYPRATLLTIDGGKHAPHLDHTELVYPAIVRNLKSPQSP